MRILLVEDDRILGETLRDFLELHNIETLWLWDERELPKVIGKYEFDVFVIDLILKHTSGEKIIEVLRKSGFNKPILVITAKRDMESKEECFLKGADDYLIKPFDFKEIILRLHALNKRRHIETIVQVGDITINLDAQTIYKGDKEIKISKNAWELLILLLKRRGEIVNNETIFNYIWPNKDVSDDIIRAYIKELRKILPPDSIKTYPGRGYRLL